MGTPQSVTLTWRESQVQRLVLAGFSSKVIAVRLGITERTATFHRNNIRAKYRAAFNPNEEVTSMNAAAVANITPANEPAKLSDVVATIIMREEEIAEIRATVNKLYAEAEVLGAHKAGLKLAIAHSRLKEEKREKIRNGYERGAEALGLQGELVF